MTTYETIFRCKWLADGATSLEEIVAKLRDAAAELEAMAADGVHLLGEMEDDYAYLGTDNPAIAERYDFSAVTDEDFQDEGL